MNTKEADFYCLRNYIYYGSNGDILLGTMDEAGAREIVFVESQIDLV